MTGGGDGNVVKSQQLRCGFISWQCCIRQDSMRRKGGHPTEAMYPRVLTMQGDTLGRIIVLLVPKKLKKLVREFRFMYMMTQDSARRREDAVRVMAASFFQQPEAFSYLLTALFSANSDLAKRIVRNREVELYFEQHGQRYDLPCKVSPLRRNQHAYQFTYWHNSLFNPNIPPDIWILAFHITHPVVGKREGKERGPP